MNDLTDEQRARVVELDRMNRPPAEEALITRLRKVLGKNLNQSDDDSGASPLQGLAEDPSLITSLIQKASPLLFARTHNVGTIEVDEVEEQRMLAALLPKGDQAPQLRPARRPRRAPRGR